MKLRVKKPEDRDAVIVILARNGYTVRQGKWKPAGSKTAVPIVEVFDNDGSAASGSGDQVVTAAEGQI